MEYKLSELFDLQMGRTPSRNNHIYWNTGDNKWISIGDLSESNIYITETKEHISDLAVRESGIKAIPENTVVMSFKLSIGKTAITTQDMYSNEAIMAFIDKKVTTVLPEYLYYLLSGQDWDKGTNNAVMGKTLNKATLSERKIHIHSPEEQKKIVDILNDIKQIIDKYKNQLNKLETLIKARFVEMFGDPIKNDKGWEETTWNEALVIKNGKNQKSVENSNGKYPICGSGGIIGYADKYITQENSVIIGRKGNINRPILMKEKYWNVDTAFGLEPKKEILNIYYLYLYCCFHDFEKLNKTVTIPSLTKKDLLRINMPIPPIILQNQFAEFVEEIDKSKSAIQKKHIYKSKNAWERKMSILSIIISVIALFISVWNSFIAHRLKHIEANMVWDDLFSTFCILIRNIGKRTVVIKCIKLIAYDSKTDIELGRRDNCWMIKQQKAYIEANEVMTIYPIHQSIYDIFAYWMQGKIELEGKYKKMSIKLIVYDIDNKNWEFVTPFTWGEVHEKLEYAVTIE